MLIVVPSISNAQKLRETEEMLLRLYRQYSMQLNESQTHVFLLSRSEKALRKQQHLETASLLGDGILCSFFTKIYNVSARIC